MTTDDPLTVRLQEIRPNRRFSYVRELLEREAGEDLTGTVRVHLDGAGLPDRTIRFLREEIESYG